MFSGSKKQAAVQAKARQEEEALRAQLELAAFGDTPTNKDDYGQLSERELWWSRHYGWLKDSGYILRPRYAPDWTPSWQGTKKSWLTCEDSHLAKVILDATRASDGAFVALKLVNRRDHPHEIEIAQYFSSQTLATSANHCVLVYDLLPVFDEEDKAIIVMPLLRDYTYPPFGTFGEAVECVRQLFEGLHFMHKHRVAHRDCTSKNIMMDPSRLYIDAFHPASPLMKRDFSGFARYKTRTERPPKYFLIDFGLSRRYDDSIAKPMEVPIWGGDKEVPEFQNSNAPCDPFSTDVFYIGNAIKKEFIESNLGFDLMRPLITDMVQKDPSKRPTMDEVVQRFAAITAGLGNRKLRSRVVGKGEKVYHRVTRDTFHWMRQFGYIARGIPAIPTSP
ncbi:kinase-like domain-containing protein [Boletus edulis]|nr:kinase-like domain-containing protein [Boletus edulis]